MGVSEGVSADTSAATSALRLMARCRYTVRRQRPGSSGRSLSTETGASSRSTSFSRGGGSSKVEGQSSQNRGAPCSLSKEGQW